MNPYVWGVKSMGLAKEKDVKIEGRKKRNLETLLRFWLEQP